MKKNQEAYSKEYREAWRFHRDYFERVGKAPNSEELWEEITAVADKVCKELGNGRFIRGLMLNEIKEFEHLRFEVLEKESV